MAKNKKAYGKIPVHYGGAHGYGWNNDPFSDPIELLQKKNSPEPKPKRPYKKREERRRI